MRAKHLRCLLTALLVLILAGCGGTNGAGKSASYQQISAEEAKTMMEEQADAVVLDVREQDEYDGGHIPGAVLLPVGTINEDTAAAVIPEKDTAVLVYCRSGNRSKTASQALADLGYTQIYEFGGIRDWPYEVER
ncbi:MAG: rhodanese-like domain-containing protein [Dysosmobacter sp.]|nr:rhodanese-like domain-containing protein [Dysosmobacter sp.]